MTEYQPVTNGTDKQIAWANDIKAAKFAAWDLAVAHDPEAWRGIGSGADVQAAKDSRLVKALLEQYPEETAAVLAELAADTDGPQLDRGPGREALLPDPDDAA